LRQAAKEKWKSINGSSDRIRLMSNVPTDLTSVVDVNPQLLILNNWGSTYLDSHKGLGAYSEKELGVYKKKNWGYLRIGGINKK
jgi:hypothetical protein